MQPFLLIFILQEQSAKGNKSTFELIKEIYSLAETVSAKEVGSSSSVWEQSRINNDSKGVY